MRTYLLAAICLLLTSASYAQAPGSGGPGPGAANVPVDGGASLMLAGGAAYALRRLKQRRASKN